MKKFRKITYDIYLYDKIMAFNRGKITDILSRIRRSFSLRERRQFCFSRTRLNHRDKFSMFNKRLIARNTVNGK